MAQVIKIKYSHWLPKLLKVDGVTIGKGVLGFLIRYFYHYIKGKLQGLSHWEAYYLIPFEVEAYEKQGGEKWM